MAARAAGTDDVAILEAVAVVVRLARVAHRRDDPGPAAGATQPPDDLASAAAQAAQHLVNAGGASLHPAFAPRLWELVASTAAHTAEQLGPRPWLDLAVAALTRAVTLCAADDPRLLALLNDLSVRLSQLDRAVPGSTLLAGAVVTAQRVVDLTPPDDRRLATRLMNLSNRLHDLFGATGDANCLAVAVATAERALAAAPDDLDELPVLRENLRSLREAQDDGASAGASDLEHEADRLALLFRSSGDLRALHEAAGHAQRSLELTDTGNPRWADRAAKLASRLTEQHRATGEQQSEFLAGALDLCIEVVRRTPPSAANATRRLENLSERVAESDRIDRASGRLTSAIDAARQLLADTPPDSPERNQRIALLATMLVEQHRRSGGPIGAAAAAAAKELLALIGDDPEVTLGFVERARRQLRSQELTLQSLDETLDMSQTERIAGLHQWLDELASTTDHAAGPERPSSAEPGDLDPAA